MTIGDRADELIDGFRFVTASLASADRAAFSAGSDGEKSGSESVPDGVPLKTPVPVTLLTGFLGSGKTTVLRRLLLADHGLEVTAIVNDLAALQIDSALLRDGPTGSGSAADAGFGLSNGCACCQLSDELIDCLTAAVESGPDAIVIEASGAADVVSMAATIEADDRVQLDGIVCLVDAEHWPQQLAHPVLGALARRQLEAAHLVLLSKTDLVERSRVVDLSAQIGSLAPGRRVMPIVDGVVEPSVVLGAAVRGAGFRPSEQAHALELSTESVVLADPLDVRRLAAWLERDGHGLLRAKGWFLGDDGNRHLLQLVGRRWTLTAEQGNGQNAERLLGLALIADDPDAVAGAASALRAMVVKPPASGIRRNHMSSTAGNVHRGCDLDSVEEIEVFVERFYRDLSQDDQFHGYFAGIDWNAHILTLVDFWKTTLLAMDGYDLDSDTVIEKHRPLNAEVPFDQALFERWLQIFYETLDDGWRGPKATLARRRGHGILWAMAHRLSGVNLGRAE